LYFTWCCANGSPGTQRATLCKVLRWRISGHNRGSDGRLAEIPDATQNNERFAWLRSALGYDAFGHTATVAFEFGGAFVLRLLWLTSCPICSGNVILQQ